MFFWCPYFNCMALWGLQHAQRILSTRAFVQFRNCVQIFFFCGLLRMGGGRIRRLHAPFLALFCFVFDGPLVCHRLLCISNAGVMYLVYLVAQTPGSCCHDLPME